MSDRPPTSLSVGDRVFAWGSRTFVMGIVNVTPDSFSGDGLLAPAAADGGDGAARDPVAIAVARACRMVADGADLLDVGGESTRPGHERVSEAAELARVVPVVAALRAEVDRRRVGPPVMAIRPEAAGQYPRVRVESGWRRGRQHQAQAGSGAGHG